MKTKTMLTAALVLFVTFAINTGCSSSKPEMPVQSSSEKPGEIWQLVTVTAIVKAIDMNKRDLTIEWPGGEVTTFTVDKQVKRLNELKKGDKIKVDYYVSLASEIREPTAEEKENPLIVLEGAAKAPPDTAPATGGLRQIKAVVTIEDIDRSAQTVTIKGPRGNLLTVPVAFPERWEKVKKGDTVIVTYTEALAVSVEKVK
jgi:Cu/Ag efflux protein CusF